MIEVVHDAKGNITAVCEWLLFDENGLISETGATLIICELDINPDCRGNGVVRKIIKAIYHKCPQFKVCAFIRENKYPGRPARFYTRSRWAKLIGE